MSVDHWPIGNTSLVAGVQPSGFASVPDEMLYTCSVQWSSVFSYLEVAHVS